MKEMTDGMILLGYLLKMESGRGVYVRQLCDSPLLTMAVYLYIASTGNVTRLATSEARDGSCVARGLSSVYHTVYLLFH